MRNHTLMQTIARANRVFGEKVNGLIVDYINVFRDLQQALAVYGSASGGGAKEGELPVEEKRALVEALGEAIESAREHLQAHGVALDAIQAASGLERIRRLDDAIEALIVNDDAKRQYLTLAGRVDALFKAVLPDKAANIYGPNRKAIVVLADKMRALVEPADISSVMQDVEQLLDESIAPKGYEIRDTGRVDLAAIDFEALKAKFAESRKRTEAEKLRALINGRLRVLVRLNQSRMDFYERFQQLIDEYNAGATNVDAFFAQLVAFAQELNQEEQRGLAEGLSEEELAVFDLLTRPGPKLSKQERERVKEVARDLLYTLKGDRLVLDWRKRQQSRAAVRVEIEKRLDTLPQAYATDVYNEKCEAVYQHVYDAYYGAEQSVYTRAA
ncbi:MAG: type I restriction enzyme endonuclease domain-containing protein, partial [Anaerolineales bacterium]